MLAQLASYLGSAATAAGNGAVKTSHNRQRSRFTRYTVDPSGAWSATLTMEWGGQA